VALSAVGGSNADWLAFVQSRPEATTFHHPAWLELLASTYRYRPLVLIHTDRKDRIVAGLPMLEVRSLVTGRRFMSLPFTDYCPPLGVDAGSLAELAAGLAGWRERMGSPTVEVRARLPEQPQLIVKSNAVRHVLPLEGDIRSLEKGLSRSWVGAIRRGRHESIEVEITRSASGISAFYRLHCTTRRRLGVPVQPKRYFQNLWARIVEPGLGFTCLARKSGKPIAGSVFLCWNRNLIYKYSASDSTEWGTRPNNLVIWSAVEWGFRNGCRSVDFGRTLLEQEGLRRFKSGLGSIELPLEYSWIGKGPRQTADGTAMRTLSRVIKRSPPIVGRVVGELLYRHFP
jgi:GNAT acetyltransferase-like protein